MSFVVGIDCGGTKTKLVRCALDGVIIDSYIAGPGNILSSGYETVKKSLTDVIQKGCIAAQESQEVCLGLCIGAAGAARESVQKQIEQIVRESGYNGKLFITHDAEIALFGECEDGEGILVIAGTGAISYGRTRDGKTHRVGGWGHLIGDEGSAYFIGKTMLNAVMKAYDGRGSQTILTELLLNRMHTSNVEDVITTVYQAVDAKKEIAKFAVLIEEACRRGDEISLQIAEATAKELVEDVCAVASALKFKRKDIKVIIQGGALVQNQMIQQMFRKKLQKIHSDMQVFLPTHDAAYGAAIKAAKSLEKDYT